MECEPGTVLGPDTIGQYYVALSTEDGRTAFTYANLPEIEGVADREPLSVTEHRIQRG